MGYDCYVRSPRVPAPDVDWTDRASCDAYFTWQHETAAYFRRSIGSIGGTREAIRAMGMGFWFDEYPRLEVPGFPGPGTYDLVEKEWQDDDGGWHYYAGARYAEYEAALGAKLAWHGPEVPGIPLDKFCSNDGWHVTKVECRSALDIYWKAREAGTPHPDAFRDDFIPFLTHAAEADGFEVF